VVNEIDDLSDVITPAKKKALSRAIQTYLYNNPHSGEIRVDVIFVRGNTVIERFEYCEL
jgi:Holliday junction resolvase-like predicted endonuclease